MNTYCLLGVPSPFLHHSFNLKKISKNSFHTITVKCWKKTSFCCQQLWSCIKCNTCFLGNAALLLILSTQHSFPDHSKVYLYLILGVLGVELISSLTCLVIYTGEMSFALLSEECYNGYWALLFALRVVQLGYYRMFNCNYKYNMILYL